ncbi:hypothetical protein [Zavarzinella formosa]|uniref:hypothetical protein n=1 Tax=Zavarzinella formosa TaxID=360055 RepID=UPI0002D6E950|nr:hypothetical protein [Zavarzinella formosa]
MTPVRLALLAMFLPAITQAADDFRAADRIIRVRGILQKHCAACHGENPGEGRLSVVDHPSLLKMRPVPTVQPREVAVSQLVTLIEEGSMPPGNRPKLSAEETGVIREWITDGAGAYPASFRDEFAWNVIADDAKRLSPAEIPVTRYLTMHHLVGDNGTGDFAATRTELLRQVRRLIRSNEKSLQPVDPTGAVFRLNLRDAGWSQQPFVELDSKLMKTNTSVNADVFDAFLLDYPLGRFPAGTPAGDSLAGSYLSKAKMARPVPFVYADWFAYLLTGTPLGKEVATLLKPTEITLPAGLTDKRLPVPADRVGTGTDIPAVDAWTVTDPSGKPSAIGGLEFYLMNSKTGQKTTDFKPGDQVKIHLKADVSIYFEVVWEDHNGDLNTWSDKVSSLLGGKVFEGNFPEKDGELSDEEGIERLTLFVSTREFSKGQAWRSRNAEPKGVDRFVHPFFLFDVKDGKYSFQQSSVGIERRTIQIKIKK